MYDLNITHASTSLVKYSISRLRDFVCHLVRLSIILVK